MISRRWKTRPTPCRQLGDYKKSFCVPVSSPLPEVNRCTSRPHGGAGHNIRSPQLLTFYLWATAISNICRGSASALAEPLTWRGFLGSRQINTICWWPDVHQRLPASELVLRVGVGVGVGGSKGMEWRRNTCKSVCKAAADKTDKRTWWGRDVYHFVEWEQIIFYCPPFYYWLLTIHLDELCMFINSVMVKGQRAWLICGRCDSTRLFSALCLTFFDATCWTLGGLDACARCIMLYIKKYLQARKFAVCWLRYFTLVLFLSYFHMCSYVVLMPVRNRNVKNRDNLRM